MNWQNLLNENRLRTSNADSQRKEMSAFDVRNPFESDFGRVVFSAASRRLHDKTQVFPLTSDDNIHSRLTHSMEVMNIGLSFSIYLSENKDFLGHTGLTDVDVLRKINPILKTSCLVHDIGNPPFGHFGEEVYQNYFSKLFNDLFNVLNGELCSPCLATDIVNGLEQKQKEELEIFLKDKDRKADYENFDGNAEGLRVLSKLQYIGDLYGLNLTYGTLSATLKYPYYGLPNEDDEKISKHKHGVFFTEAGVVRQIAEKCGLLNEDKNIYRHPLAFLMEAADSICYLVMDIDDAVSKGWLSAQTIMEKINVNKNISDDIKDKIIRNKDKIIRNKDTEKASLMKEWVMLRTTLLSHLMDIATKKFIDKLEDIENGLYNNELIEDGDNVYSVLKKLAMDSILSQRDIISLEITGRAVITGLFDSYFSMLFHSNKNVRSRVKALISKSIFKATLHEHLSNERPQITGDEIDEEYLSFDVKDFSVEERFRLIRDYVACMTDKFALSQYQRISGQKIS